jgi:phospholipid/cholesterol/gamma-HCH transport system substrate-binding protein
MRGRSPLQSLAASPTMVGAITTLIVIVAVFLAYNANQGLPFVPTYRVSVEFPNAARLTNNNEVRIGGHRVGVVESIEAIHPEASQAQPSEQGATDQEVSTGTNPDEVIARLNLKLDKDVEPLPMDSTFRVRYRSSFGLKYLEITRGDGAPAPEGYTFPVSQTVEQTEFDDINNTFDAETRTNSRINLQEFGDAFAGRGTSLNQTIEALNPLFTSLKPVARVLAAPQTRLRRFFPELGDAARIVAPVAEQQAELFTNMAVTFAAISEDPEALKETISEGPPTLQTGIAVFPFQQTFLRDFTTLSHLLRPGVRDLRISLPTLNSAIDVGTGVLRRTPRMNKDLRRVFVELKQLVEQPTTKLTLQRLEETFDEATPLSEYVVPAQTVCNYWDYWFTFLPEHLSEQDQFGFMQRVGGPSFPFGGLRLATNAPPPFPSTITVPGEVQTPLGGYSGIAANGRAWSSDVAEGGEFDPYKLPILHGNPYGPTGQKGTNADCQTGQTGYPLGALPVPGQSPDTPAFGVSDIPGSRGPTTLFYDQNGQRSLKDTRVASRAP